MDSILGGILGLVIGVGLVFGLPVFLILRAQDKEMEKSIQQRKQANSQTQSGRSATSAYSESQIVNRFMSQIDAILGEDYLQYECIRKLRLETLEQLKNAYRESPQELIDFSNSIDHRLWALKQLNNLTYEEIGTGRHHLRDVLKPDGRILANVNRMCLQKALNYHYIDETEYKEAINNLNELIYEVGTWA